jgi:hypothetical protein
MRAPPDCKGTQRSVPWGLLQTPTATLLKLPTSDYHTVRSVSQEAYSDLWDTEPDRAERWLRVSNMDQVFGVGRPPSERSQTRSSRQPFRR